MCVFVYICMCERGAVGWERGREILAWMNWRLEGVLEKSGGVKEGPS